MLTYRRINYEKDLGQITNLIQKNLNAGFSEEFFQWKHLENPFGKSFGLLALEEEKIVGLRMFMFWEFHCESKGCIKAIRPVDTVTDSDYRGRGIFKKLTLDGLEECKDQYRLIFNTPNENSLPGYLKMGWQQIGTLGYFKIGVLNPFFKKISFQQIPLNQINLKSSNLDGNTYNTLKTKEFLIWRYSEESYKIAAFGKHFSSFIIYKNEVLHGVKTLIIYEIMGDKNLFSPMVHSLGIKSNSPFVYFLNTREFEGIKFLKSFNRQKPVIIYKDDQNSIHDKINFSLGDLEGKL